MTTTTDPTTETAEVEQPRSLSASLERRVGDRWQLLYGALYVVGLLGALKIAFVQDDAFISYRYARNLVNGDGLVFNPGERVEGYTNFLWTVIHAIPEALGWSTPLFGVILGLVLMLATITAMRVLAARAFPGSKGLQFICVAALVTNVTFLGYGTSGMETMLQTLLILLVALLLLPASDLNGPMGLRRRIGAGALIGVVVLVRLDSLLLVGTTVITYLICSRRSEIAPTGAGTVASESDAESDAASDGAKPIARSADGEVPARGTRLLVLRVVQIGVPAAIIVVPWLVWKYSFYGSIIPNTFFAKSTGSRITPFLFGLLYLAGFFLSYGAFLLIPRLRSRWREFLDRPFVRQAYWGVPLWFLYILIVGGDFMEFRFMMPILPLLALLAGFLVDRYFVLWRQVVVVGLLLLFSAGHAVVSGVILPALPFSGISHWPTQSPTSWKAMGEILGDNFPGSLHDEDRPTIAIAPLGVIPYYSDLVAIDMLGLTDEYVAQHGEGVKTYYPGHVRMAPIDYLERREVSLIVGEPFMMDYDPDRTSYRLSVLVYLYPVVDLHALPEEAKIIEIPLTDKIRWVVIYLRPNPQVDAAIERNDWRVLDIERTCLDSDLNALIGIAGTKTCD